MLPVDPQSVLASAVAWVGDMRHRGQTHLFYPVSRLQRRFRLGRPYSLALAQLLAQCGEWTITRASDGTRYARIHARADA